MCGCSDVRRLRKEEASVRALLSQGGLLNYVCAELKNRCKIHSQRVSLEVFKYPVKKKVYSCPPCLQLFGRINPNSVPCDADESNIHDSRGQAAHAGWKLRG